jgi:hypothetical protein
MTPLQYALTHQKITKRHRPGVLTEKALTGFLCFLIAAAIVLVGLATRASTAHGATCVDDPANGVCCAPGPCLPEPARNYWEIPTQTIGRPATFCTSAGCVPGVIRRGRELGTPTPNVPGALHHMLYEIDAFNLPKTLKAPPFDITVPGVAAVLTVTSVGRNGVHLQVQANKSLTPPLPAIPAKNPAWICYRADQLGQTAVSVVAPDQFGSPVVKIGNLTHLCVPGSFDGSIPPAGLAFACFAGGQQKPLVNPPQVWVSDPIKQFSVDVHPDHQGFCAAASIL